MTDAEKLQSIRKKLQGQRTSRSGMIRRVANEAIQDPTLTPTEYLESRLESDHEGTRDAALRLLCTLDSLA